MSSSFIIAPHHNTWGLEWKRQKAKTATGSNRRAHFNLLPRTRFAPAATEGSAAAYFPLGSGALPPEALTGFERNRVLCVDDVHKVAGDAAWERALFHLFNEAAELRTRLIFASAVAPRQSAWTLEDWRSRAAACVVYQLHELDDEGRIEALRLRAEQRGLQLPHETAEYLLKRMPRDLPSLFEILDALDEASLIEQRRLTIPFIRDELEKHAKK